jgi:hypothetical protein
MSGSLRAAVPVPRWRRGSLACLAAIAGLGVFAAPAAADVTEVGGGAFGESVNVTLGGVVPVQSGPLPSVTLPASGGGPFTASVASASAPASGAILTTGLLQASTQGDLGPAGFSESSASVANVNVFDGRLTATAVRSSCRLEGDSAVSSTTLVGATLDGQALPVNPPPNTTINAPGMQVILNETIDSGGPGDFSRTVNAIHIRLLPPLGSGDIIISQSRCRVAGPNVVIPVAPIGLLGFTAVLGATFAGLQVRRRRRTRRQSPS